MRSDAERQGDLPMRVRPGRHARLVRPTTPRRVLPSPPAGQCVCGPDAGLGLREVTGRALVAGGAQDPGRGVCVKELRSEPVVGGWWGGKPRQDSGDTGAWGKTSGPFVGPMAAARGWGSAVEWKERGWVGCRRTGRPGPALVLPSTASCGLGPTTRGLGPRGQDPGCLGVKRAARSKEPSSWPGQP